MTLLASPCPLDDLSAIGEAVRDPSMRWISVLCMEAGPERWLPTNLRGGISRIRAAGRPSEVSYVVAATPRRTGAALRSLPGGRRGGGFTERGLRRGRFEAALGLTKQGQAAEALISDYLLSRSTRGGVGQKKKRSPMASASLEFPNLVAALLACFLSVDTTRRGRSKQGAGHSDLHAAIRDMWSSVGTSWMRNAKHPYSFPLGGTHLVQPLLASSATLSRLKCTVTTATNTRRN